MPVLYFNYHIGGTRVSIYNRQGAFSTFILNMCAVIGGIYAMAHFLYNTLFMVLGTKIGYQELGQWLSKYLHIITKLIYKIIILIMGTSVWPIWLVLSERRWQLLYYVTVFVDFVDPRWLISILFLLPIWYFHFAYFFCHTLHLIIHGFMFVCSLFWKSIKIYMSILISMDCYALSFLA